MFTIGYVSHARNLLLEKKRFAAADSQTASAMLWPPRAEKNEAALSDSPIPDLYAALLNSSCLLFLWIVRRRLVSLNSFLCIVVVIA